MAMIQQMQQALIRADLWRVLALAFHSPTPQSMADLAELAKDLAANFPSQEYPIHQGILELAGSIELLDPVALEHEHNALFSLQVLVPAYEGSYQYIDRGAIVGDVAGYYKAFGLNIKDHSGPPDSLWNELAFLSWLSLKEAYAMEKTQEEALAVTRDAMREFLKEHLGRWVGAFSKRLLATTENPLYVTATHLLLAAVSLTANDLEIKEIKPLEIMQANAETDVVSCPLGNQQCE